MRKMQLLSMGVLAMVPGAASAAPSLVAALDFTNGGAAWEITANDSGVPLTFELDGDPTNVGIAQTTAGSGQYNLIQQVFAPAGYTMSNIHIEAKASAYSSWVMDGRIGFSVDYIPFALQNDYATSAASEHNGQVVVDVPLLNNLDASGNPAYTDISSIYVGVEIVKGLPQVWTANNVRDIKVYADLNLVGTVHESEWAGDRSGDWNSSTVWRYSLPNGVDAAANFLNVITTTQTAYTNTPVTVGKLAFDCPNTYVIAGGGSLTIQTSTGAGSVSVLQGNQKINLPLIFASDTDITVASGAILTIGNPATIQANKTVTKSGDVLIQAPLTLEAGASLVLASGPTTAFGAPSLGGGARIDVKNNSLTIDYRGQATPAATIKAQLASGYSGGVWNGDGIATSSAVLNQTGLGWKDDTASKSILVKYTYYGDANLDGQVDISDLGALATAWQTSAVWSQGDFDYSGFVDISDLGKLATNWQLGVGSPLGPSFDEALASVGLAGVSVPEPAALGAMVLAMGALRRRRRICA